MWMMCAPRDRSGDARRPTRWQFARGARTCRVRGCDSEHINTTDNSAASSITRSSGNKIFHQIFRPWPGKMQACSSLLSPLKSKFLGKATTWLVPGCENDSKPRPAAHHALVGLVHLFQRVDFIHRPHTTEHTEGQRILRINGGA